MLESDFWVVLAMLIYFVVVVIVGFVYAKKSNESSEAYFLGGRKLGPWMTALSAEASDMSGWLLMGLPGVAYFSGASDAVWIALGLAIGTYLNWKFVAKRLRKYSQKAGNSITIPDFFANRFGDKKSILLTITAVVILIFFSVYVGSTFVTTGKLFNALFGLDYATMMIIGALIVFLYTFIGGYLSVCTTDLIQGMLMIFALAVVFIGSITAVGGVEQTAAVLGQIPGFLSLGEISTPILDVNELQVSENGMPMFGEAAPYGAIAIASSLVWGLGYFGMPQVLVRFMSISHSNEIKKSRIIAVVWVVISFICAVCIGLLGRALLPTEFASQAQAESIFVSLSQILLPSFIAGVVMSGIFAATMSSASSYLLLAGSAVSNNIYKGLLNKDASDTSVLIVARITLVVILLFGIVIAIDENSSIFNVVSYAWAGLGASFGPLMLAALYWRRANLQGAIASVLVGATTVIAWNFFVAPLGGIFAVYELLPAFILSGLALVVVSLATNPPAKEITDDFDTYMELDV